LTNTKHAHAEPPEPPLIQPEEMFENDPQRDRKIPKRRLARERVMQMLYAHELGGGDIPKLFLEMVERDLAQADERTADGKQNAEKAEPDSPAETVKAWLDGSGKAPKNARKDNSSIDDGALGFARELTAALTEHSDEINALLSGKLERWDIRRVALIDRLLIQIGIAELLYFPEIPPKATINELIEIAKDFSTKESGKFINGLLHAVMTHLRESGGLNKTGRGLVGESASGFRPAKTIRKP
jgi:transcription antitermination protein NusB